MIPALDSDPESDYSDLDPGKSGIVIPLNGIFRVRPFVYALMPSCHVISGIIAGENAARGF